MRFFVSNHLRDRSTAMARAAESAATAFQLMIAKPTVSKVLPKYSGLRVQAYGPVVASCASLRMVPAARDRKPAPRSANGRPRAMLRPVGAQDRGPPPRLRNPGEHAAVGSWGNANAKCELRNDGTRKFAIRNSHFAFPPHALTSRSSSLFRQAS